MFSKELKSIQEAKKKKSMETQGTENQLSGQLSLIVSVIGIMLKERNNKITDICSAL